MSEDSDDLLCLALFNQSIIDDDVLLPGHSEEIGVAVRTPLTTVNDVQLVEREVQLLSQVLNAGLELARFQGRELVEQRQDSNRIDSDHEDLKASTEEPQVVEELVTGLFHDGKETRQDRRSENES